MEGILQSPKYSKEFLKLIDTDEKARALLEGSCVFSDNFNAKEGLLDWEHGRRFIADALKKDGTILDYGSANGFLLKCLQEWSKYKLDPYGVENDPRRLAQAKKLFPEIPDHFVVPENLDSLPRAFDQIYWAVGDNLDFANEESRQWFRKVKVLVAKDGRFILGFYDTKVENLKKIKSLQELGVKLTSILENPAGGNEMIAWFDI